MKLLDLLKKRVGGFMSTEIKINTVNGKPFRTYIFKDGAWNDEYIKTTEGSVLFNENSIRMNGSSIVYIENLEGVVDVFVKVKAINTGADVGAHCFWIYTTKGSNIVGGNRSTFTTADAYARNESTIKGQQFDKSKSDRLGLQCGLSQVLDVQSVWIEEVL